MYEEVRLGPYCYSGPHCYFQSSVKVFMEGILLTHKFWSHTVPGTQELLQMWDKCLLNESSLSGSRAVSRGSQPRSIFPLEVQVLKAPSFYRQYLTTIKTHHHSERPWACDTTAANFKFANFYGISLYCKCLKQAQCGKNSIGIAMYLQPQPQGGKREWRGLWQTRNHVPCLMWAAPFTSSFFMPCENAHSVLGSPNFSRTAGI